MLKPNILIPDSIIIAKDRSLLDVWLLPLTPQARLWISLKYRGLHGLSSVYLWTKFVCGPLFGAIKRYMSTVLLADALAMAPGTHVAGVLHCSLAWVASMEIWWPRDSRIRLDRGVTMVADCKCRSMQEPRDLFADRRALDQTEYVPGSKVELEAYNAVCKRL